MITRYTIVQYLPDPITGERINFGVLVWNEDTVQMRFLRQWKRVQRFSGRDIGFLHEFVHRMEGAVGQGRLLLADGDPPQLSAEVVEKMVGRWMNAIQFTEPRASTRPANALLQEVATRFLREEKVQRREGRDRRHAAAAAFAGVRHALEVRDERLVAELLKRKENLPGKLSPHEFDAVLANGTPWLAAQGISFETPEPKALGKEIDAVSFRITDVRERLGSLPIGVVVLPPKRESREYERAKEIFQALDVRILKEREVSEWAGKIVDEHLSEPHNDLAPDAPRRW